MTGSSYGGGTAAGPPHAVRTAPWERTSRVRRFVPPPLAPPPPPVQYAPPRRIPPTPPRPPVEPVAAKPQEKSLLASTGSIAVATLVSRITGFMKQVVLLAVLGAAIGSSFTVASVLPNMISELVLGAVLTAIVVPVLVRAESEDADGGAAFVRRLFTAAFVLLGMAALLATAAAPILTKYVFLSDDGKVDVALTTALSFLLLPAILFYGMTALLTAILNTRQVFKPGAWAPVLNNLVVLAVLALFWVMPGEISLDPVRMGDPKLLVLGLGVTFGVVVQACSLVPAIRRQRIDLRPLWGLDARLRQFGGMAVAIVLYVLISQAGYIFATNVSSHVDAAGPAIYSQAWLLLQLPYGVLGVTVLTAIMPRMSRNAAANDTPAVVDDLSVATRLTMITLIPVITLLTFAGPQVGVALYSYGNFGADDAHRLGEAVSWSAFTLIPYSIVLIQLRVFYAREQAWTPTWIILGITAVKIGCSALAPVLARDSNQVVMLLGAANGLGFLTGAIIGTVLLRRTLGSLRMANVGKTVWVVLLASLAGAVVMVLTDRLLGLSRLSTGLGGPGAVLRVAIGAVLLFAVTFTILRIANIAEVVAVTVAVKRRLTGNSESELETEPEPQYDPMMDAQTMVIPVIRADAVDITGVGEFPYPVRQRMGAKPYGGQAWGPTEGVRMSDDSIAGKQAGGYAADTSQPTTTGRPTGASTGTVTSDARSDRPGPAKPQAGPSKGMPEPRPLRPTSPVEGQAPVSARQQPPTQPPAQPLPPRGPKLIPGASVAGGRYRLLAAHGGARGLSFWQAKDTKLDREVALTFVDAEQAADPNSAGDEGPQAILSRTLRLGRINSSGLARVLDVVRGSSGGIVVAEWTPGRSLEEMAKTVPSPIGAARAIRALASAAELTHRSGGALSIDHPDRIRISAAGDAVLAFPGTLADSDAQSDVRGLGAMLYALITAHWPLTDTTAGITGTAAPVADIGGLPPAVRGRDGAPVEPRELRPEVPFEISAVAMRAMETNRGVRTAATVQHVLDQASVVDQKTDLMPALRLGQRAVGASGHALADPEDAAAEKSQTNRTMIMIAALGAVAIIVLATVGWLVASKLAGPDTDSLTIPGLTTANNGPSSQSQTPDAPAGVPVKTSSAIVYSWPNGTADDPDSAQRALDNNPSTVWLTDSYTRLKGVGLLVTFPEATDLTHVWVNSPTQGARVEIRSATSTSPQLTQTQEIGSATIGQGVTQIPVTSNGPVKNVIVWFPDVGTSGKPAPSVVDVGFTAAS